MGSKNKRLIEQICDWDNLVAAHKLARRGKRRRFEVVEFEQDLWSNLGALQMEMLHGTYRVGRYRHFVIYEPKRRDILAAPYRDRVAQHAIVGVTGPIWDRSMIADTYACRPEMGTHAGADRVQVWLRRLAATHGMENVWCLKMDISKYFASISHALAKRVMARRVRCDATLAILNHIIDSTASEGDPAPVGVPPGNLTSQWVGNLAGDEIDQWAKRCMRLKHYIRYMDDMVVLHPSKAYLLGLREEFRDRLASLGFRFSYAEILPISRGVNFLGYRLWPHHRLLRQRSIVKMRRDMRVLRQRFEYGDVTLTDVHARIMSWLAHTAHANAHGITQAILGESVFSRGGEQAAG